MNEEFVEFVESMEPSELKEWLDTPIEVSESMYKEWQNENI